MPPHPAPHVPVRKPPRPVPVPVDRPSPAVQRAQVAAIRSAPAGNPPQQAVYAPWDKLVTQADARYKTEITAALRQLERESAVAGQLLDTAYTQASEAAGLLEQAAWAAWKKYMAAADDTRNAILTRAVQAHDELIADAHGRYDSAMTDAEQTYKTILQDAQRAQSAAKGIVTQL